MLKVRELLDWNVMDKAEILSGERWIDNVITGVTIIEAPDIVRFITGGEVLLTGLYAFKYISDEEMERTMCELSKKKISAVILKRGRDIEMEDEKIVFFRKYSKECGVPLIEVPFEVSFKDIMSQIMESLSNEEVKRLKYFKTLHDNFEVFALSLNADEDGIERILEMLAKIIRNPVAVLNQNMGCLGTTDKRFGRLSEERNLKIFEPEVTSTHLYMVHDIEAEGKMVRQYVMHLNQVFGRKIYLVVTETNSRMDAMDFIAIESAVAALQYEFSKQYAIIELEKKYQNDILHNLLNGKARSPEEIRRGSELLGMEVDIAYRVIILSIEYERETDFQDINQRAKTVNMLNNEVQRYFGGAKLLNDLERVIIIQKESFYRKQKEIKSVIGKIQEYMTQAKRDVIVKAGVGKAVDGLAGLKNSYKEANDSLVFMDMVGDKYSRVMIFSDMGVLKLLCKVKTVEALLEYIPESLQRLYDYKKTQREDLIITLQTYLDRNQNLAKTAQDLYIHYKTAAYRMEKIQDITGIDFNNSGEVLSVRIGMVARKMYEHYENEQK